MSFCHFLPLPLPLEIKSKQEEGEEKENRAQEVEAWEGDEQCPLVAIIQALVDGIHKKVEVSSDDGDNKEVDGHRGSFYQSRYEVHHQSQRDSNPHLPNDVGGY